MGTLTKQERGCLTAFACLALALLALGGWAVYLACVVWPVLEQALPVCGVGAISAAVGFALGKGAG